MAVVRGNVDLIQGNRVEGWAALDSAAAAALRLHLHIDGKTVVSATATEYRADLAALGIRNGLCGFRLEIPDRFLDNRNHLVDIEVAGHPFKFDNFPNKTRLSVTSYSGALVGLQAQTLTGWARAEANRDPVFVQLLAGDVVLQAMRADRARNPGDQPDGFQFELGPHDLAALRQAPLRVRVAHTAVTLAGGPSLDGLDAQIRMLCLKYLTGDAALVQDLTIEGWYLDRLDPAHRFGVEAIEGETGTVHATGHTGRVRTIELDGQSRTHPCGFRLELPRTLLDGKPHSVRLQFDGRVDLEPLSVDGTVLGQCCIEEITATSVRGWAISYLQPASPIVEVVAADNILGSGLADIFRADLADAFHTTGAHVFNISLDEALVGSTLNGLTVRLRDSKTVVCVPSPAILESARKLIAVTKPADVGRDRNRFVGQLEDAHRSGIAGWAMNATRPLQRARVELLVGGIVVSGIIADTPRRDVAKVHGTDGRHGFHFDFPMGLGLSGPVEVAVQFADTQELLEGCPKIVDFTRPGLLHPTTDTVGPRSLDSYLFRRPTTVRSEGGSPRVAVIVLNHNGADHLEALFASFQRFNTYPHYRIAIIDHGSTDASESVCARWSKVLNVQFLPRGRNYSFSQSNNFGADSGDEDILLFLNNDIVLGQCLLAPMLEYLADESIGAVGIKLRSPPDAHEGSTRAITFGARDGFVQHLGIKFQFHSDANPIAPYEVGLHPDTIAIANSAWRVPAVTAAAMMVRQSDFAKIGGFDEDYFYGYEDVDFCCALRALLNKHVICASDVVAFHRRGATKTALDLRSRKRFERNIKHLRGRFGAAIRQDQRREALAGDRFLRMQPLRIAFAVSGLDSSDPESELVGAYRLGGCLAEDCRWEVRYLDPENWYELEGCDVIVALSHAWDPNKITSRDPGLVQVAWIRDNFGEWLQLPWLQSFHIIWSASSKMLGGLTGRTAALLDYFSAATDDASSAAAPPDPAYASDYCVTGNLTDRSREIVAALDPESTPYRLKIFGSDWGKIRWLSPYWQGPCPTSEMSKVYASTKIALDDADAATRGWGLVRNRVVDAIAAGALVLTNDRSVSEEMFAGHLPVFETRAELTALLDRYLGDDGLRTALVERLRRIMLDQHTYRDRAKQVQASLQRIFHRLRMCVRTAPAGSATELAPMMLAVAELFRRQNLWVRPVEPPDRLELLQVPVNDAALDDVIFWISASETSAPEPAPDQINIRLHLGPASELSIRECQRFDLVILPCPEPENNIPAPEGALLHLFDHPDARSRCFSVESDGTLAVHDTGALKRALEQHLSQIMATIESANARLTRAKPSERKS